MLVTTPNDGDAGARRLVGMYEDVELVLLLALRDAISKALEADTPQARQRQLNILLDTVAKQLNRVGGLVESQAGRVAADEYDAAIRAVYEEVGAELQAGGVRPDVWRGISSETAAALRSQHVMVAREIRDVYQQVTMTTVRTATVEGMDHPRALQVALNRFADKGITGFVDKGGRRWSIDVYADMAVRTMRNNIRQEGHLRGYEETGVELVRASWHPASAPQCFPFQNELLAISGPAGPRVMVDPATVRNVTVTVKATLRDAIAAGYHHTNCKHRDVAYTPGDKTPEAPETTPEENKRQYEATQRQRQIERTIRKWRKREAVALTPDEAALAKRKVKDWQAAQREHVGSHSFLSRFYHREQLRTN